MKRLNKCSCNRRATVELIGVLPHGIHLITQGNTYVNCQFPPVTSATGELYLEITMGKGQNRERGNKNTKSGRKSKASIKERKLKKKEKKK